MKKRYIATVTELMARIAELRDYASDRSVEYFDRNRLAWKAVSENGDYDGVDENDYVQGCYWEGRADALSALLKELSDCENS